MDAIASLYTALPNSIQSINRKPNRHFAPTWTEVAAAMAGTGIHIAAVSCLAEQKLCQREQIHGYPTLKAFGLQDPNAPGSDKPDEGVVIKDQTKDKIVSWLKNHYRAHFSKGKGADGAAGGDGEGEDGAGDGQAATAPAAEDAGEKLGPGELKRRRAADAFTSLRFAMDHDVFLGTSRLGDGALDSLKNLLRALMLLFPGAERRRAFSGILGEIEPLEELGIAEWEVLVAKHMGPLVKAEGAGDGDYKWTLAQPDAGYTGGLWILFHTLTARSALASAEDQDARVQPAFVLGVIHGFVEHFFGCAECKGHFLRAYEEARPTWEPQGAKGAVLWIWDLHDKVNVRLEKPRWPSTGSCPRCWKGKAPEPQPQPEAIYKALIRAYDIRDVHMNASGAGAAGPVDEEDEGMAPEKQIVALSHDYVFIGIIALIVLGAAVWKLERKLSLGRKKKRSEGRLVYELVGDAAERV